MADPTIPLDRILAPIPPGVRRDLDYAADGSGRDYAYDYEEIEKARQVIAEVELRGDEFDQARQGIRREPKAADWNRVLQLGVEVLSTESKDIRVAAWVVEALGHLRGWAGLRDGFQLIRRLQARYWESSYPRPDGDPDVRRGPYEFLDNERILPLLIRGLPIVVPETRAPLSYLDSRAAERNEAAVQALSDSSERNELRGRLRDGGKLLAEDWDAALRHTPPERLALVARELGRVLIAFKAWERDTDRRCGGPRQAPSLAQIGAALADCARVVRANLGDADPAIARGFDLAVLRFEGEGRPLIVSDVDPDPEPGPAHEPGRPSEPGPRSAPPPLPPTRVPPREPSPPPPPVVATAALDTVDDAYQRVREAAAFLRDRDPDDPVAYLLVRSLRLGSWFANEPGDPGDPAPGPDRETRRDLRRQVVAGDWDAVLDRAESALGEPEGAGWLDAHRWAIQALEETGRDRAARACRALLGAVLDHIPDLASAELDDGTAGCSPETRRWLDRRSGYDPGPRSRPSTEMEHVPGPESEPPSADDAPSEAEALAREGRAAPALAAFGHALGAAPSDRERFLLAVRFVRAAIGGDLDSLAIPILEQALARLDELPRLWEARRFAAEAARLLREVYGRVGVDPTRLAAIESRMAWIDPATLFD